MAEVAKRSDLGVRSASAVVMLLVAGTALWLGDIYFLGFVFLVSATLLFEWFQLVRGFARSALTRIIWLLGGFFYIGAAGWLLIVLRANGFLPLLLFFIGTVVATDVGAYFSGRLIGGPKIAPAISPSKTWAGLIGGMVLAALLAGVGIAATGATPQQASFSALGAALLAVVAQAGDFFESWMKRRAGVKDSGSLIPGHGGVFDRVDGLLPVVIVGTILAAFLAGGQL
jgi:phosphatidate cytidylyltransferase